MNHALRTAGLLAAPGALLYDTIKARRQKKSFYSEPYPDQQGRDESYLAGYGPVDQADDPTN